VKDGKAGSKNKKQAKKSEKKKTPEKKETHRHTHFGYERKCRHVFWILMRNTQNKNGTMPNYNAMFAVLETGRTDFLDLSLGDSLSREMTKCMLVWV
jgi:hypothetical protein